MKNAWNLYSLRTKDYNELYIDNFKFRLEINVFAKWGIVRDFTWSTQHCRPFCKVLVNFSSSNRSIIDPFPLPDIEQTEGRISFVRVGAFLFIINSLGNCAAISASSVWNCLVLQRRDNREKLSAPVSDTLHSFNSNQCS